MDIPFVFEPFLGFGAIGIFLVLGVLLRAKIGFFQSYLLPSCLIGGSIGCLFLNLKIINLPVSLFENFAYHFFNIAFISVGLTWNENKGASGKQFFRGAFWMALMKGVTWPLQAIIGLSCILIFQAFGTDLFAGFGLLLPIGFNEGPGQALSIAKVYTEFGFQDAVTVGLSFAIIGYLFCFFVGMPLVKKGLAKGSMEYGKKSLPKDFLKGVMDKEDTPVSAGRLTFHPENIDNMSFQLALVGLTYIVTYVFLSNFVQILPPAVGKVMWGFFFGFGMIFATLIRLLMKKLGFLHVIDPGVQRRITGFGIDIMLTATLMIIQLGIVWKFIIPILIISIPSGILTLLVIVYFGKRMDIMNLEHTIVTYGMYTGQMSTGLLLLRMVDPEFKSQLLTELGIYPFLVLPFTATCMILATTLPLSQGFGIVSIIGIYAAIMAVSLILLKVTRLWGPSKKLF